MSKQVFNGPGHLSVSQIHSIQENEEWRPVPDADGYEVSSLGRVRSYRSQRSGRRRTEPRIIGEALDRQGYAYFRVGQHGGTRRVHRMVLWVFVGPPPFEGAVARHLNDIKSDNTLANLAWGTQQDNVDDRGRNGNNRWGSPRPERAPFTKLTWDSVREIRRRRKEGAPLSELASCYGVGLSNISLICLGRTWKEESA